MRQKLIYLLKHNLGIQAIYRAVMSACFKLLGLISPLNERLVLFSSFMGSRFNDSPRAIYEAIKADPKYANYRLVWAFERPKDYPEVVSVKIDTLRYFHTALRAKYWVTNTNIERGLHFKREHQVYLNTWHGIALKHIGNDCPGRKDYDFSTLDYMCVSGRHDEKVFRSAFGVRGASYLCCGMPRNDRLWHASEEERARLRRKLGIGADKTVLLYAPTWRDSVDGGRTYELKPPVDFENWRRALGDEYVILFRAHHQTTKVMRIAFDDFIRDASNYPDVNDLMIASDMLITDYSAIAFDYSILCRPILCFAYDYEEYLSKRGTYFDIDECYPEKSCRTEAQLLSQILSLDRAAASERTRAFRDQFVEYGGQATRTCVEKLFAGRV